MASPLLAPAPLAAKPTPAQPVVDVAEETDEQLGPLYRVICHDDPVTTMEFVVEVLRGVFRVSQARAYELMLRVHHTGAAVIGRYPRETAERKVARATSLARASAFPLTFTVEADD
jgi:ATP-dependent Clp protease adaptor protein ClpS